jgi:anti-sigma regulatory factor (Ser/Thr protein kinase)
VRFNAFGQGDDEPGTVTRNYRVLLVSEVDRGSLAVALRGPYSALIELGGDDEPVGDWAAVAISGAGFYLSLTTATGFGLQVAALVSDELVARGVVTGEQRSVVELCLQEAVANAIVHGNLGIASTAKDYPEGYRVFSQLVNERLNDPVLRRRRTDIFTRWSSRLLDISVADQGTGFDTSVIPTEVDGTSRSGRGFVFMRALAGRVAVTDGGRCTSLRFML